MIIGRPPASCTPGESLARIQLWAEALGLSSLTDCAAASSYVGVIDRYRILLEVQSSAQRTTVFAGTIAAARRQALPAFSRLVTLPDAVGGRHTRIDERARGNQTVVDAGRFAGTLDELL
ncbi:hypothetical protein [Amycolatopsis australiensis]|uniref:hypothetical protein n=1 Tax=Amycolatopsis australiensis TaxID=546364 RepID=UPI00116137CE|nr:hypothetical protein [Amycolatopsis australiensis]